MDSLRHESYMCCKIELIDNVSYEAFFNKYMLPNKPCIFKSENTKLWASRRDWVTDGGNPDFTALHERFGAAIVPVANCREEQYSAHPKEDMLLSEYLDYWKHYTDAGYPETESCLYLKDWHFMKAFPDYCPYTVPSFFQSDWLNEFWDTLPQDDYRFVYMGPKGTWTSFHSDVYRSHSWSANICGRKKWIFYPPGQENHLKDRFGQVVYNITSPELSDRSRYPAAHLAVGSSLEVIQGPGEVIFVPSGWHHQVFNLEDTISINHNWLNACNVDISWCHLKAGLSEVKREIHDCRDMDGWQEQCQMILNATAGIDYKIFIKLLLVIGANRLKTLDSMDVLETSDFTEHPSQHPQSGAIKHGSITVSQSLDGSCLTPKKQAEDYRPQNYRMDQVKSDSTTKECQYTETFGRLDISHQEIDHKCAIGVSVTDRLSCHTTCECGNVNNSSNELKNKYSDTGNVSCKHTLLPVVHTKTVDDKDNLISKTILDPPHTNNSRPVNLDSVNDIHLLSSKLDITAPNCRDHVVFDLARVRQMLLAVMADEDYRELAQLGLVQTVDDLTCVTDQIGRVLHVEVDYLK